jgi:putative transcriptional regulator
MTSLRHHPHDETLMSFASGTLDPAFSLVLGCHLQFCSQCRRRVRVMEDIGGLLLEGLSPYDDDADFFQRTMERFSHQLSQQSADEIILSAPDAGNEVIMPTPLAHVTGLRRETIPWKSVSHDLRRFDLAKIAGAKASAHIINIEPGAFLPPERHGGQLVVVLWGAYDYDGAHFERGDLHDIGSSDYRGFKGDSPEGVTYLTAVAPVPQFEILRTGH